MGNSNLSGKYVKVLLEVPSEDFFVRRDFRPPAPRVQEQYPRVLDPACRQHRTSSLDLDLRSIRPDRPYILNLPVIGDDIQRRFAKFSLKIWIFQQRKKMITQE
jgi:hypothetical protein